VVCSKSGGRRSKQTRTASKVCGATPALHCRMGAFFYSELTISLLFIFCIVGEGLIPPSSDPWRVVRKARRALLPLAAKVKKNNAARRRDEENLVDDVGNVDIHSFEALNAVDQVEFVGNGEEDDDDGDDDDDEEEESEEGDEEEGVVTEIDDILAVDEEDEVKALPNASAFKNPAWNAEVEKIIRQSSEDAGLLVRSINFLATRIEVVAVGRPDPKMTQGNNNFGTDEEEDYIIPSVEALGSAHRDMYAKFEAREVELDVVGRFEIAVASPGIGSQLRSRREFESFRGFPVVVTVKEEYKKKMRFEGTLLERDDENVLLSLKGRVVKIPRTLVDQVCLPKPRYEATDSEMRKLR